MVRIHPDPPSPCLVWLARSLAGILCALYDWGISSAGRAPALQAGGRRFDPVILHQFPMHSVLLKQKTSHWQLSQSASDVRHSALNRLSFFNNQEEVVKRFIEST